MNIFAGFKDITFSGLIRQVLYIVLPSKMYIKFCYKHFSNRTINLREPKRLSEKWWWCMYYNKKYCPDLIRRVADKYEVQGYMQELKKGKYLKKTYGVYTNPEEINFNDLPDRFAIKITQESGLNIICTNKESLDVEATKKKLKDMLELAKFGKWRKHDLAWINNGNAKIIVEEFIEKKNGEPFDEIRFLCFNGEPKFEYVVNDYLDSKGDVKHSYTRNTYDLDWNPIKVRMGGFEEGYTIKKPREYEEALALARDLCKEFLFLRLDLYVGDGKVYLSEFTVAPAGLNVFSPDCYDFIFGDMLKLPDVDLF